MVIGKIQNTPHALQNISFKRNAVNTESKPQTKDTERVLELNAAPDKIIANTAEKTVEHRMQEIQEVLDLAQCFDNASGEEIRAYGYFVHENLPEQRIFHDAQVKYFRDTPFEQKKESIAERTAKSHSEIAIGHRKDRNTGNTVMSHVSVPGRGIRRNVLVLPKTGEEAKEGMFIKGLVFDDRYDFKTEDVTIFDENKQPVALVKGYAAGLKSTKYFNFKKADAIYLIQDNGSKAEILSKESKEYREILEKCPDSSTLHLLRK